MTASVNGSGAYNARVRTGDPEPVAQSAREQRAHDFEAAAAAVEAKLAAHADTPLTGDITDEQHDFLNQRITALRAALDAARAEAEQACAEAQKGSN